jgi:hypothetical protein
VDGQPIARTPHQPTAINLTVENLPDGRFRLSSTQARGWAHVGRTSRDLALGVRAAFTEVQVAAYSHARGEVSDLDVMTEHRPGDPLAGSPVQRRRRLGGNAPYSPAQWQKTTTSEGLVRWRSPMGRLYRPDSQQAMLIVKKREALNLPI